ncbi:MAG: GH3 auxin-responsive promoter family protein [Phycisphaerales bacterium]|nr:GH3 auxin-responsive promoter family protein [Phycisphaerales bacterium]
MAGIFDRILARVAYIHARNVFGAFTRSLNKVDAAQGASLARALAVVRGGEWGRQRGLDRVSTMADLRRATPLQTYEDIRPFIDRVADGDTGALFSLGQRIHMFAMSSGTASRPKRVPVPSAFVNDYKRGWNTFGVRMLTDHPDAILRGILQSSGRYDESKSAAGIPCGAITGLMARTQKGIVRRYYVAPAELAHIVDVRARQYAQMRFAVGRDVAFAVTANPSTLINMARIADQESERLIRDIRDGTLMPPGADEDVPGAICAALKPDPARARQLETLRTQHGRLAPRDYWRLSFVACWTGGTMGHYLPRLADWWGDVPVRDIGLLASEGRVTIPLDDDVAAGVLDVRSGVFEFIPVEQFDSPKPDTAGPREVEVGREYAVVLTNTTGLVRYRLDDIVRVEGWVGQSPLLRFMRRGGGVSSLAGEKLTESQVVAAMSAACEGLGVKGIEYVLAARWGDPPCYELRAIAADQDLGAAVDSALCAQNDEYSSRRSSGRLGSVVVIPWQENDLRSFDAALIKARGSAPEQYKRPCLLSDPEFFTKKSTHNPSP